MHHMSPAAASDSVFRSASTLGMGPNSMGPNPNPHSSAQIQCQARTRGPGWRIRPCQVPILLPGEAGPHWSLVSVSLFRLHLGVCWGLCAMTSWSPCGSLLAAQANSPFDLIQCKRVANPNRIPNSSLCPKLCCLFSTWWTILMAVLKQGISSSLGRWKSEWWLRFHISKGRKPITIAIHTCAFEPSLCQLSYTPMCTWLSKGQYEIGWHSDSSYLV